MAASASRISKAFAFFGKELPIVAFGMQSQLQHSKGIAVSHLAVGLGIAKLAMAVFAAAAHYKFADTARRIELAIRVLRSKALVIVIVSIDHHIGISSVQRLPEGLDLRIV